MRLFPPRGGHYQDRPSRPMLPDAEAFSLAFAGPGGPQSESSDQSHRWVYRPDIQSSISVSDESSDPSMLVSSPAGDSADSDCALEPEGVDSD